MAGCKTLFFFVVVPLLAVAAYYCTQQVRVYMEANKTVRVPLDQAFKFLRNPQNIKAISPDDVLEVNILEFTPNVLDEQDGLLKDFYQIQVTQDISFSKGVKYNATIKSSSEQKTVLSEGFIPLPYCTIHFQYLSSLKETQDGTVELTQSNEFLLPRIIAWLGRHRMAEEMQASLDKFQRVIEKAGVNQGTQTD